MVAVLTAAVGVLALLVFVLSGAVIELYRDVRQLREVAGILDRPLDVDLGDVEGAPPSRFGLPETLDSAASALVLFLSERCGTCRALAARLDGRLPDRLWVVLEARGPDAAAEFLESYDLTPHAADGRLLVDADERIAESIGLDTTPVGFRVENGRITSATTVPSGRYLSSIVPKPVSLGRSTTPSRPDTPAPQRERRAS